MCNQREGKVESGDWGPSSARLKGRAEWRLGPWLYQREGKSRVETGTLALPKEGKSRVETGTLERKEEQSGGWGLASTREEGRGE